MGDMQTLLQAQGRALTPGFLLLHTQGNVRLMIDAEHSWFQPAIDHAATELQRAFNTRTPTILNTYQCYLRVRPWPGRRDCLDRPALACETPAPHPAVPRQKLTQCSAVPTS